MGGGGVLLTGGIDRFRYLRAEDKRMVVNRQLSE